MIDSRLFVFPTQRSIMEFYAKMPSGFAPKAISVGTFFSRAFMMRASARVSKRIQKIILYSIIADFLKDNERYAHLFVFERSFLGYLQGSDFLLDFFREIASHNIDFEQIPTKDIYADYADHLQILSRIYVQFNERLSAYGFARLTQNAEVIPEFIQSFSHIEFFLDGFLSPKELDLLAQACHYTPIHLHIQTDLYNIKHFPWLHYDLKEDSIYTFLLKSPKQNHIEQQTNQQIQSSIPTKSTHKKKSPHFCTKALQQTKAASIPPIEVLDFKLRIAQCGFVLEKVRQLLEKGTPGERIVVITPDEAFSQYLALLDSANNLNYAMGTKLSTSPKHLLWCEKLEQILNEIPPSNTSRLQYLESIFAYIFALEPIEPNAVLTPILDSRVLDSLPPCPFSERLRTQILEILFEYHQIQTEIEQLCYADLIHMLFRQIKDLSLDDIKGGKVRVMGILETREITCDYAIVVDFNENFIPHIKDSDMFLNTFIRKTLSMPTLQDRQDLQKHYYYQLFTNTKYQIFITYTKNDQTGIASMIDELLLQQHISLHYTNGDTHYALFKPSAIRAYKEEEIIGTIQKCTFSPTSINTFIACKRRFYYRYILHLEEFKETNQKKDIGIILHKALEEVYKPYINQYINENTLNTIIKSFEQKLEDTFALESHINTLQYQISRFEMQGFWEKEREYAYICGKKGFMLLDCEREFQATLTHNGVQHNIRGIIDRLDKANDAYRIIDYKYAKKPTTKQYLNAQHIQLAFYKLAMQNTQTFLQEPNKNLDSQIYYLRGGQTYLLDEESFESAKEEIFRVLECVGQKIYFKKSENKSICKNCPYATMCDRG